MVGLALVLVLGDAANGNMGVGWLAPLSWRLRNACSFACVCVRVSIAFTFAIRRVLSSSSLSMSLSRPVARTAARPLVVRSSWRRGDLRAGNAKQRLTDASLLTRECA